MRPGLDSPNLSNDSRHSTWHVRKVDSLASPNEINSGCKAACRDQNKTSEVIDSN